MRRLLVLLLLVSGCSLPLPDGVRTVGSVEGERRAGGEVVEVRPPGPREGQTPEEVVRGFLAAQASAADRHAVARSFLTPDAARSWDDAAEAEIYDIERQRLSRLSGDGGVVEVTVSADVTGRIGPDGAFSAVTGRVTDTYGLVRVGDDWRLADVPAGVRLTAQDRERSFRPVDVFYAVATAHDVTPRLAPDRVFLPVGPDLADALVTRALQPPSSRLLGSVAFVPGVEARDVTMDGSGVVTADLSSDVEPLSAAERQALSARLVWTLRQLGPGFRGLRLTAEGRALEVPGQGAVQDDGAWSSYDPEGLGPNPPYYFVAGRRLRTSANNLPANAATAGDPGRGQAIGVDAVAVSPDRTQIALLEGAAPGPVTVWTGPPRGPTYRRTVTAQDLRSPTWGSGDRGLWLLRGDRSVVRIPPGEEELQPVPVLGRVPAGRFTSLATSRDGTRVALVAGGVLHVGRVVLTRTGPSIADLRVIGAELTCRDVTWATGSSLVVLDTRYQVLRLAVDGSTVERLNTAGRRATAVTAAGAGLLLEVESEGRLYALTGRVPVRAVEGLAPAYPG